MRGRLTAIKEAALKQGWQVPKIYDIQKSLKKAGHEDITRIKILSFCQPDHAYKILKDDENRKVTAIMPCRIGIYETKDGKVYISEMNVAWAFTFPSGALAAVSTGITYVVFKFSSLYQIFWLLNVFLIGVWIIVAGLTARAVVKGEAFKGH